MLEKFKEQLHVAIESNIDVSDLKMYDEFASELLLQAHSLVMLKYSLVEAIKIGRHNV